MSTTARILAIMGSGETSPTMVKIHRQLIGRLSQPNAVVLDTPYGFQENAPELALRAVEYFEVSVNTAISPLGLTRMIGADALAVQQGLSALTDADYVFAGPGSPTYALRQWKNTQVSHILHEKLQRGGIVTFASAAALTLGTRTVPVYEIYKCGEEPYWLEGLNLLGEFGIPAVVIPHYNNAEGGHHDTRFCYLGETRLNTLEQQLDDGEYVLGVDEHTGIVIDLNERTAEVVGNGVVTLRVKGNSTTFASGEVLSLEQLQNPTVATSSTPPPPVVVVDEPKVVATSLASVAQLRREEFESALAAGDANGATRAILELENDIKLWSADTLTGTDADSAREVLRSMIVKLGTAATGGLEDPRERVAPYVEALLAIRKIVRAEKRFDLSDIVRDALALAHIEVRDTPDGVEWLLQVPE
ncbi:MAG: Type 1 glutamine amidotransferase-like domain-containing protein [Actinobacteria bacterium]|nr:Type 1 glutamine amidotransferase-like domain-containing protein [Actinomycetota bacterium]